MKPRHTDPDRALAFDWHADDRSLPRMAAAVAVTLLGIGGLFVIFRVAAPEPGPPPARSRQVLVLDPSVPAERALIHQAMDRSFPILPVESGAPPRVPAALPRLIPVYQGRELKLKPLPADPGGLARRPLVTAEMSLLPPLPPAPPPPAAAPRAQILRPVFHAPLDARAPEPEAIEDIPLAEMTRPVFQVVVDPRGNVTAVLPLAAADSVEVTERLREAVARMRFRPDSSGKAGQGRVSFRWEDAAP